MVGISVWQSTIFQIIIQTTRWVHTSRSAVVRLVFTGRVGPQKEAGSRMRASPRCMAAV